MVFRAKSKHPRFVFRTKTKKKQIKKKVVTKQNEGKSIDLVVSPIDIGINFSGTIWCLSYCFQNHTRPTESFSYKVSSVLLWFFGGIAETTWTSFLLGFLLGYFISFVCPFIRSFSEAKFTFQGFFLVSLQFRALTVHDKTEHRYVTSSATNNHTNTLKDNTWTRKYVVKETEASNNTSRKGRIFITYIIFISPTNAKLCRRNYTQVCEFMRFRFVTFLTFFLWLQLKKLT